jgi:hypothetical protein
MNIILIFSSVLTAILSTILGLIFGLELQAFFLAVIAQIILIYALTNEK